MSHYPPPSSFGGPFTPNTHFTPSPNVAYPPIPHLPFYPGRGSNNQGQDQSMALSSVHYTNAYGFNTNQSSSSRPGIAPSSYPGYGQIMNGPFPPSPFPPIPPSSFSTPSQIHPVLHHHDANSVPIHSRTNLPVKPSTASALGASATPENSQIPATAISELEDGELSDREERSKSKVPTVGKLEASRVTIDGQEGTLSGGSSDDGKVVRIAVNSSLAEGEFHLPHEPRSRFSSNGVDRGYSTKQTLSNRREPSILQRYSKSPKSPKNERALNKMPRVSTLQNSSGAEVSQGTQLASSDVRRPMQIMPGSTYQHQLSNKKPNRQNIQTRNFLAETAAESHIDMRERAKDVLKELYPHEIGFAKLVDEGIDPRILLELYAEIGIQIHSPAPPSQRISSIPSSNGGKTDNTPDRTHIQQTPISLSQAQDQIRDQHKHNESSKSSPQMPQNVQASEVSLEPLNAKVGNQQSSTSKGAGNPRVEADSKHPSSQAHFVTAVRSSDSVSKPDAIIRPPKVPATNLLSKTTNNKPGDKALERKDYIARMLAAKAGKPIPAASTVLEADTPTRQIQEDLIENPQSEEMKTSGPIEERRLFIGNLSSTTTEIDLRNFFSGFLVKSVSFPSKPQPESSVCHGFVELATSSEALRAISLLSKKRLLNHQVAVQLARTIENAKQDDNFQTSIAAKPRVEMNLSSTIKDGVDAESKKKAQTELARQKIEALKSRDNNQYENQKQNNTTSSAQNHDPSLNESQLVALQEGRAVPLQTTAFSHKVLPSSNSTFSNKRPPFSIPGLFMAASSQDSVAPSAPLTYQTSSAPIQIEAEVSSSFRPSDSIPRPELHPAQLIEAKIPTGISAIPKSPVADAQPIANKTGSNEQRKRQKAADFIDSPSVRVKRVLGQNEETSVIIEISEEEDNQESEEEEVDMDVDVETDIDEEIGQGKPLKESSNSNNESGKPKGIRDLPPLSDFPPRKKIAPSLAIMTPPVSHTPAKSKEPEDLKLKEKEIELMNRKIAELEQRIKAKQTASRGQTPEKLGQIRPSPKAPSLSAERKQLLQPNGLTIESGEEAGNTPQPQNLDATDKVTTNVNEAEVTTHMEPVQSTETAQNAKITQEAKAVDEAVTAQDAKASKAVQEAELLERAKIVQAARVAEQQQRVVIERRAEAMEQAQIDKDRSRAAEVAKIAEEERRRSRRSEIEFGLPLLDAEVERTKQKLQTLKRQMDDLENEVQKGVEGRRILMEELLGLTPKLTPQIVDRENNFEDRADPQAMMADKGLFRLHQPGEFSDSVQTQLKDHTQEDNESANSSSLTLLPSKPAAQDSGNELLADEQKGDNRENGLSTTNINEGEVTDHSPERSTKFSSMESSIAKESTHQKPAIADIASNGMITQMDEDVYEPPATFDTESSMGDEKTKTELSDKSFSNTASNSPLPDVSNSTIPLDFSPDRNTSEALLIHDEGDGFDRNLPLADVSDSDDYEPPEPTSPVETASLQSSGKDTNLGLILPDLSAEATVILDKDMLSTPQIQTENLDTTAPTANLENKDVIKFSKPDKSRYIAYESPLKQLKSYRFRPEYLAEVPRGFRSLTYSHGINPEKPLCRYEVAGGVCNDDSCEGQHIRDLGLSDNMILVQMGAIPEGLDQKQGDAYATGLKQIIQEIRGRKVTDFNVVASEIAAYRAKFLGENVKVLPL